MKNCPVCGSDHLRDVVGPEVFEYEGHSITIDDYRSVECGNCGESFATQESLDRAEPILRDLHRFADGLLSSVEIRQIRESFCFSQDAFGELLGGGKKAFARYENGRVTQARAMDNLLRVLKAYPQALSELRGEITGDRTAHATSTFHVCSSIRLSNPRKPEFNFPNPMASSNLLTGAAA